MSFFGGILSSNLHHFFRDGISINWLEVDFAALSQIFVKSCFVMEKYRLCWIEYNFFPSWEMNKKWLGDNLNTKAMLSKENISKN